MPNYPAKVFFAPRDGCAGRPGFERTVEHSGQRESLKNLALRFVASRTRTAIAKINDI
jgi:hypothetical protein